MAANISDLDWVLNFDIIQNDFCLEERVGYSCSFLLLFTSENAFISILNRIV